MGTNLSCWNRLRSTDRKMKTIKRMRWIFTKCEKSNLKERKQHRVMFYRIYWAMSLYSLLKVIKIRWILHRYAYWFLDVSLKVLANEDTLLRTHCCRHKCFPVCPRAQHLLRTQILCPGHKNVSDLFRNILCPQQMFPSLRSPRTIMGNNVSATLCPRLPGP